MKSDYPIQDLMFTEFNEKNIFNQSHRTAMEYLDNTMKRNVFPTESAIDNLHVFDEDFPAESGNTDDIISKLHEFGSPATVSQLGGRYFGFVDGSSIPAGLAAKHLATYWDQNSAMYVLSPIASKLESIVEGWIREIFHLSEEYVAGFVTGSSMATFCGLAAARYHLLREQNWNINKEGLTNAPKLRIVTGRHAHSTVLKAVSLLGLGTNNIEWIDVDDQGRIIADQIPALDKTTILILQAGNVNSGSFDDFKTICNRAKTQGAWIHIDGAFGLWASASNKLKYLTDGIEMGDSLSVDGHKTLNTPYDSGILICKNKDALKSALHMSGSYIVVSKNRDSMFYTPEMSRRARIVEIWATMKYLGKSGISQIVDNMHHRAVQFKNELSKVSGFKVLNKVCFNQVIVACSSDELTNKTLQNIQADRVCWVGGSKWFNRNVIRISVSSWATTETDVQMSVESFKTALLKAQKEEL